MKLKKVLAVMALAALMTLSLGALAGCGQSAEDAIRQALTEELDAYKNLDQEIVDEYIEAMDADDLAEVGIDGEEFVRSFFSGFDYRIESVAVDGDTATATLVFTNKSFTAFESAVLGVQDEIVGMDNFDSMSYDEVMALYGQKVMEALDDIEPVETNPVVITYTKDGNTWEPSASSSDDVAAALLNN